ncbi:hypothetical protein ACFL6F_00055 [Planctomycetota bacterium]
MAKKKSQGKKSTSKNKKSKKKTAKTAKKKTVKKSPKKGQSKKRKTQIDKGLSQVSTAAMEALIINVASIYPELIDRTTPHFREPKRRKVSMQANITLILDTGKEHDSGTAVIRNMSSTGALLADIKLKKKAYPVQSFAIHVRMKAQKYSGIGLICRPVRFAPEVGGIGVRFEEAFVTM